MKTSIRTKFALGISIFLCNYCGFINLVNLSTEQVVEENKCNSQRKSFFSGLCPRNVRSIN